MAGGIDDVGLGVLFGLNTYLYDFIGLMMYAEHLEAVHGVGPHTISVPRICPADDISLDDFPDAISDELFPPHYCSNKDSSTLYWYHCLHSRKRGCASKSIRSRVLQISGGSRTTVGGYAESATPLNSAQFEVSDHRTLDEVVEWLLEHHHVPSFLYCLL